MQKLIVELLSDFSRQDHIQIIYKPQLVIIYIRHFSFTRLIVFLKMA